MKILRFFAKHITRYDQYILWISVIAIVLGVFIPYIEVFLPKLVISLFMDRSAYIHVGMQICGITILLIIFHFIYEFCMKQRTWRMSYIQQGSAHDLLSKNLTCDYSYSQDADTQAIYHRLRGMTDSHEHNCFILLLYAITDFLTGIIGVIGYALLLSQVHIAIVFILFANTSIYFLVMRSAELNKHRQKEKWAALDKKIKYMLRVTTDLTYSKDLRLYGMSAWLREKTLHLFRQRRNFDKQDQTVIFQSKSFCAVLSVLRDVLCYGILLHFTIKGAVTIENLILYMGVIRGFSIFVSKVLDGAISFKSASLYISEIQEYMKTGVVKEPDETVLTSSLGASKDIEFRNVCFSYDGKKKILDNFTLKIKAGTKIALVGGNGAGKTTLIHLLCGLLEPDSGEILLNGISISRFTKIDLYNVYATVFQDSYLVPVSLRENIAPMNPDDTSAIEQCIALSGLDEDLAIMEKNLDAPYSRVAYEDGIELSGGQKQKLYFARMLYKKASVVLLDEPTSALDPLAESKVYQQYANIIQGRTAIFVSHRLSSTRFCDYILFLKDGIIKESGTHLHLLEICGEYYTMFQTQSSYYEGSV